MSDDKKYYYLKLKDNFFEQDHIKVVEAVENGYIYSNILLKMYLRSLKFSGKLMITEKIPYDPDKPEILAKVLNHDVAHLKDCLSLARELEIIEVLSTGEIFMLDIQNFIGHSSSEADRKREYRKRIEVDKCLDKCLDISMDKCLDISMDKNPPEREREREKEKEKEKEREPEIEEMSEDVKEITKYLFDEIMDKLKPPTYKNKKPDIKKWYGSIEKLNRIDGIDFDDMKKVIDFALSDDFWKQNILSSLKFRKHYNTLFAQMDGRRNNSDIEFEKFAKRLQEKENSKN